MESSDEIEIAARFEEAEREYVINQILQKISRKPRDIESLIDDSHTCDDCGALIPIARQRAVLQVYDTCDYCIDCQTIIEKKNSLYS